MFTAVDQDCGWDSWSRHNLETTVGTWHQQWEHWDRGGLSGVRWVGRYPVSPWVHSPERIGYECRLGELFGRQCDVSSVSFSSP